MIDTHLHLWQLSRGWYGWNMPALGAVHADSSIAGVAEAMSRSGVTGAVVVQAADTVAETDWLLGLARDEPRILGVVGYLPLTDPAEVERLLARYAGRPLVGVRQLWHDHHRPDALADPSALAAFAILGDAGLAVDVPDAFPALWPALTIAAERVPQTRFVLDHCGKPPFGDPAAWREWEAAFSDLAARPNVHVKISGLFGGSGSVHAATDDELGRVVELARTLAGAERIMIGSDWPMTRGRLGYAATLERLTALLASWPAADLVAATGATAQRVYGLPPGVG
jgi:L-fuconolactonase